MFVGHGLLAFALVATVARWRGWSHRAALRVGLLAGCFATVPDIDVVYGLAGFVGPLLAGTGATIPVESFWDAGNELHRGVTHSLVVGAATALAAGAISGRSRVRQVAAVAAVVGIAGITAMDSSLLDGTVALAFGLAVLSIARLARSREVTPRAITAAALVGLLSHPFGDLFTGSPPDLLYPLDVTLVAERLTLSADPTIHLLGAFWLELATVWLALLVVLDWDWRSLPDYVDRRATLGVGYAGAALAIPAPTLDVSYQFVFSVLAVGAVGVAPPRSRLGSGLGLGLRLGSVDPLRAAATGLAAVTLASVSYAAVFVLF